MSYEEIYGESDTKHISKKLTDDIKERIKSRLKKLIYPISQIAFGGEDTFEFIVGGNCLNTSQPNDYDLFPCTPTFVLDIKNKEYTPVFNTKNATTYNIDGTLIQFCNYHKTTIKELVESFDFAHIKIGAKIKCRWFNKLLEIIDIDLCISDDWLNAKLTDESYYTGSEYPLSSLIRLNKYYKRGDLKRKGLNTVLILTDIIKRGFANYPDFKDQVEAVDLVYSENGGELFNLYRNFVARGLVAEPNHTSVSMYEDMKSISEEEQNNWLT